MRSRPDPMAKIADGGGNADENRDADHSLRGFLGYNIKRANLVVQGEIRATLEKSGFRTASFSALVLICDTPDMTQTQLASALSIERSGVVLIVDDLENRDLITRNRVEGDRRTYALRATLAGIRMRDKVFAQVRDAEDRLIAGLGEDDITAAQRVLNHIEKMAAK
ncbi:MAG: MarR family winged helix-turn-helix transcriptional regulator [Nitratireductor sp.]